MDFGGKKMELLYIKERQKKSNHFSNRKRVQGTVPGIIYGKNLKNILIEIDKKELQNIIARFGQHAVFEIDINGIRHKVLIKELQKDVLLQDIIHVDLEQLNSNTKVTSEVPLIFLGEEKLRAKGGILQKSKNSIKVKCKVDCLPQNLSIDASRLNVGQSIKVYDVEVSKEIMILDESEGIIATFATIKSNEAEEETVTEI